jgi:antitoxin FitA
MMLRLISLDPLEIRYQKCNGDSTLFNQGKIVNLAAVTIRSLPDEIHRAIKVRAEKHNRSAEAEMRAILEAAVRPENRLRLGTAISNMSREIGLTGEDVEALNEACTNSSAEPLLF